MIRPVDQPGAVVADLSPGRPDLPFNPEDAVWAIGGKWEQQFMGEKDGHETLLPGVWHVEKKEWASKSWDGWKVPDPAIRCNGCHTVGLNIETGAYQEIGIGCESCVDDHQET